MTMPPYERENSSTRISSDVEWSAETRCSDVPLVTITPPPGMGITFEPSVTAEMAVSEPRVSGTDFHSSQRHERVEKSLQS